MRHSGPHEPSFHSIKGRVLSTPPSLCPAADLLVLLAVGHEDASFTPLSFTPLRIQETGVCVSPVELTSFHPAPNLNTNSCITGQLIRMQIEVSAHLLDTTKKWLTLALKHRLWFSNS
jgi:hypothetical protein